MLTVLCVYKQSAVYDDEYVLNLRRAVKRNLSIEHHFACLTDTSVPSVDCIPLAFDWPRWWAKAELFRPDFVKLGRILYIDLDTVITGSLDDIAAYQGPAGVVKDFYFGGPSQSMLSYMGGSFDHVWDAFCADPQAWMDDGDQLAAPHFGDQVLLTKIEHPFEFDYWQDHLPGQVVSYRKHCRKTKLVDELPAGARVVSFHGRMKPHLFRRGHWAHAAWRGETHAPGTR